MSTKILLVEDDEMLNAGLCFHLEKAGHVPVSVVSFSGAIQLLDENQYALATVDINLPDGNGFELSKNIQQSHKGMPVIFLTAQDIEKDILLGYDAGAVDYITKPFSVSILLKRVQVAIERNKQSGSSIQCGHLMIDLQKGQIIKDGEKVSLTVAEWKLLQFFSSASTPAFIPQPIAGSPVGC